MSSQEWIKGWQRYCIKIANPDFNYLSKRFIKNSNDNSTKEKFQRKFQNITNTLHTEEKKTTRMFKRKKLSLRLFSKTMHKE